MKGKKDLGQSHHTERLTAMAEPPAHEGGLYEEPTRFPPQREPGTHVQSPPRGVAELASCPRIASRGRTVAPTRDGWRRP
jgi:hypothetical protein